MPAFKLQTSIDQAFPSATAKTEIDFLFISHFHLDHVSGVKALLERTDPRVIVIPYTDPLERLMAALQSGTLRRVSADTVDFYVSLIADPAAALSDLFRGTVLTVRHDDEFDDGGQADGPDREVWAPDTTNHTRGTAETTDRRDIGLGTSTDPSGWILRPYVDVSADSYVQQFRDVLRHQLKLDPSDLDDWRIDQAMIKELLTNQRPKLSKALREKSHNYNVTSLSLYSGPGRTYTRHQYWAEFDSTIIAATRRAGPIAGYGWLGTGDAPLLSDAYRARFLRHYSSISDGVGAMALPHHGSVENYHLELRTRFSPAISVVGSGNLYEDLHPAKKVREDIEPHHPLVVVDRESSLIETSCSW